MNKWLKSGNQKSAPTVCNWATADRQLHGGDYPFTDAQGRLIETDKPTLVHTGSTDGSVTLMVD